MWMQVYNSEMMKKQKMNNINKGYTMKTTKMMLLSVVATMALGTGAYATCATNVDMGNHRITNVADPEADTDVVNKRFFYDTLKEGYVRDDVKEVVYQISSGLVWQDNAAAETVKKQWVTTANYNDGNYTDTSGDTATTYCTNLSLGGFSDWRLPTRDELYSIVKSDATDPSISAVFHYSASSTYWSSTTYAGLASGAWGVYFGNGGQYTYGKSNSSYVRCVRAGQP